jgi:hypothetical protein
MSGGDVWLHLVNGTIIHQESETLRSPTSIRRCLALYLYGSVLYADREISVVGSQVDVDTAQNC